jgi:hypothetical protein
MSSTASFEAMADAPTATSRPAPGMVIDHRDALSQLWPLDPVPARAGVPRLGRAPKRQLADPALAGCSAPVSERCLPAIRLLARLGR